MGFSRGWYRQRRAREHRKSPAEVVFEMRAFEEECERFQRRHVSVMAASLRLVGARGTTLASSFPLRRSRGAIVPARFPAELPCAHLPDARAGEHFEVVQEASIGRLVQDEKH